MEILKIAAIGLITAVCTLMLREVKSDISFMVLITGSCIMLLAVIDYFTGILDAVGVIIEKANLSTSILTIVMKIIGIGYITEFTSGLLDDVGMKSLSDKITLAGKLIIFGLSIPILIQLFDLIGGMLT